MKTIILATIICLLSLSSFSQQKVKTDSTGNYVSATTTKKSTDKSTGKYFIDTKNVKYEVFISVNGKLYYYKTSKKGNVYKVYIQTI